MISHGTNSEEKCFVEVLARFAVVMKELCLVGRNKSMLLFIFIIKIPQ